MECYEGATMIKTFRGLIADTGQDTIVLHTNDGAMGYRIVKFQLFPNTPGTTGYESVCKIYKVSQTEPTMPGVTGSVDFSDNTLLAASYLEGDSGPGTSDQLTTIFDHEIFNQDIYITHLETYGSLKVNYYIELEQVKLDLGESTVVTLKNLKNLEPGG